MNPVIPLVLALRLSALMEVLDINCNMGTRDFPEMYAAVLGLCPQTLGIHFWQIIRAHVTTIKYFSRYMSVF